MSLDLVDVTVAPSGGASLFAPVSASVRAGQCLCLIGPSGRGKSTLLSMIGGHLPRGLTGAGQVVLNGRSLVPLPAEARRVGLLFQDAPLFPHLSVGDNLAFGLAGHVSGRSARRAAISDALSQAGLTGFETRDPATLSGGQRVRVALMRALLAEPEAVLLDEPFSRLDVALRAEIRSFVLAHIRARGIPAVLVSHDPGDADVADNVLTLAPWGASQ